MKKLMYSGVGLLVIALAFVAFNLLSSQVFTSARLDLTEQKLYTITPGTQKILADLKEPVTLSFFYSDKAAKDLVDVRNYARRVEEMLHAYVRESGGKITLKVIDPEPFSAEEDQAAELGLQGVPLNLQQNYRVGLQSYLGTGGDNFSVLAQGRDVVGGIVDVDALALHVRQQSAAAAMALPLAARIVNVAATVTQQ